MSPGSTLGPPDDRSPEGTPRFLDAGAVLPSPAFGPFRLDARDERLWRGDAPVPLRPKAFAVLRYLVERPGRLVTKDELLAAVWPDLVVGEDTLTGCLGEIRRALGDDPRAPRFVQTVHRRGFRFVAPVETPAARKAPPAMVGRERELGRLHAWAAEARAGRRRMVLVAGDAGAGKTVLVDAFLAELSAETKVTIARGDCIEQADEAYLPVLAALTRLGGGADGTHVVAVLARHAPTWLLQMPALVPEGERRALERRAAAANAARMLREAADALEALAAERPLVVVLEDLHWSDAATVALLAYVAARSEPARLLVVGTYRPVDAILREHPLKAAKQQLVARRQCEELALELLGEEDVRRYVAARLPRLAPAAVVPLARTLHQRTDGHALFMATVVDELVREGGGDAGALAERLAQAVPESLVQFIDRHVERLAPEDRRLLAAASVAGVAWPVAAVAAALEASDEEVEERSERLAQAGHLLIADGVEAWADGTLTGRYAFRHAIYRQAVYARIPAGLRAQLHRRIGERLEAAQGTAAGVHDGDLARHFEEARDHVRAVHHLRRAAATALGRWAYREAASLLERALALLEQGSGGETRAREELDVLVALGSATIAASGQASPDVERVFTRARALCRQLPDAPHLADVLQGLRRYHTGRGEHARARALGAEILALGDRTGDPALRLEGHFSLGLSLFYLGALPEARDHLLAAVAVDEAAPGSGHATRFGQDTGLMALAFVALTLWYLGFSDAAERYHARAAARSRNHPQPLTRAVAIALSATLAQYRGDWAFTESLADELRALAQEHQLPLWTAVAAMLRGIALAGRGHPDGVEAVRAGVAAYQATGGKVAVPFFQGLLVNAYVLAGLSAEALVLIDQALAQPLEGTAFSTADIHRARGEILAAQGTVESDADAERSFREAVAIAGSAGARALELRAAVSLARLFRRQRKPEAAREALAPVYAAYTEGFETPELREARALLAAE